MTSTATEAVTERAASPEPATHKPQPLGAADKPAADSEEGLARRVYIGNLPVKFTARDLREFLSEYGKVSIDIPSRRRRRFPLKSTFAFATFSTPEVAAKAQTEVSGKIFEGRELKLSPAEKISPRKPTGGNSETNGSAAASTAASTGVPSHSRADVSTAGKSASAHETAETNGTKPAAKEAKAAQRPVKPFAATKLPLTDDTVYIRGFTKETTEADIKELFAPFGEVETTMVTKGPAQGYIGNRFVRVGPKRYAFVKVGKDAQARAIDELNEKEFNGRKISVRRATAPASSVDPTSKEGTPRSKTASATPEDLKNGKADEASPAAPPAEAPASAT